MQRPARYHRHASDKQRRAEPVQTAFLRVHHADSAPQHAVKHVVKGIAVDIKVNRQPFKSVDFLRDRIRVGNNANHHHQGQKHFSADVFHLDEGGDQIDNDNGEEEPQVVEHRFLQHVFQR